MSRSVIAHNTNLSITLLDHVSYRIKQTNNRKDNKQKIGATHI